MRDIFSIGMSYVNGFHGIIRTVTNTNQKLSLAVMQCSLGRHLKKTLAETTVFCEIMNVQIQGNNLRRSQGYGKRKNASRALIEANEEFLCNRPFATNDHMVQNPPCWRASSLLFPHWDIKTKRPEPVKLDLPLF